MYLRSNCKKLITKAVKIPCLFHNNELCFRVQTDLEAKSPEIEKKKERK